MDFAVGGVAIGADDEENVEGAILPAHIFLLEIVWGFGVL